MPDEVILEARGVCKHFGRQQVLHDVDLRVQRGEALGLVGPNGAGKTTLFGVLAGLLPASQGTVRLDGQDIGTWDAARRCHAGVARTHQIPRPFAALSVFDNTLVAAQHGAALRGAQAEHAARHSLERCGLGAMAHRPAGSMGLMDRKRLELARALATRPRVLLLDEIGGGLSEAELQGLVELVRALRDEGLTVVWIEHVLHALLKVVTRLICMDAGRVLAQGEPRAVMRDARVVEAYLGGVPA